jgi:DNA-binding Lrp family transcriptional regulator
MGKENDISLKILDIKDRRILKELFENGRKSYSKIAKNIKLSKEVVNYRIKKLIERGILIGFNTVINVNMLGWEIYLVNICLKNINENHEKNIIETMTIHPNFAQVQKCIGNYDLMVKIFAKNYIQVNKIMKELELKFKENINNYNINFIEKEIPISLNFLYLPFKTKKEYNLNKKEKSSSFISSSTDLKILKLISNNARIETIKIAKELNISRELARYHLKKLEENNVILKYRPSAWLGSKSIGFSWYFIMLKLNELDEETYEKLKNYITNHFNITYFYKSIGTYDILFEIRLKTSDELNQVLMEIRTILKDKLKSHELLIILKEFKYTYFPDCLLDS